MHIDVYILSSVARHCQVEDQQHLFLSCSKPAACWAMLGVNDPNTLSIQQLALGTSNPAGACSAATLYNHLLPPLEHLERKECTGL